VKIVRQSVPTILLSCAALTLSMHAAAEEHVVTFGPDGRPRTVVAVEDFDLSVPSDVQALYTRLQEAATAVCKFAERNERRARQPLPFNWRQRCFDNAVDEAVRSMDRSELTALHRGTSELLAER
jgi:UrcA family protein